MWALRAQTDKHEYARVMRGLLEATPNLEIREGMAVDLDLDSNGEMRGVKTFFGITFRCRAAVITTGTFMNGRIWIGKQSMPAGRCVPSLSEPVTHYTTAHHVPPRSVLWTVIQISIVNMHFYRSLMPAQTTSYEFSSAMFS